MPAEGGLVRQRRVGFGKRDLVGDGSSDNINIRDLTLLGCSHSFAQPTVKAKLLADYDARVAAFEKKYGTDAASAADALGKLAAVKSVTYGYAKRTWGLEFK